jgi:hypothetical protein
MSKNGHLNDPAAGVRDSLSAIRHAKIQLRHLTGTCTSPTKLANSVRFCWARFLEFEVASPRISHRHGGRCKREAIQD